MRMKVIHTIWMIIIGAPCGSHSLQKRIPRQGIVGIGDTVNWVKEDGRMLEYKKAKLYNKEE